MLIGLLGVFRENTPGSCRQSGCVFLWLSAACLPPGFSVPAQISFSRSGFMRWLARLDFVEQIVKFYTEVWQLILSNIPNNGVVNTKIIMDQPVSHSRNLPIIYSFGRQVVCTNSFSTSR